METFSRWMGPLLSTRFIKFCGVGLSGVFVNLGILYLAADVLLIQDNLASAIGIEVSILCNFLINDTWTFRDRRAEAKVGFMARMGRYHLTAFVGGVIQWFLFVTLNLLWLNLLWDSHAYFHEISVLQGTDFWLAPVLNPPEVGQWKYLSQLVGIGVATFWNFLVNFFWTWRQKS